MRRFLRTVPLVAAGALLLAQGALAAAPVLSLVTVGKDRHPAVQFSAPKADSVTIYFATKPDRATDGSFLRENIDTMDFLTTDEVQAGRWTYERQLDPGTYYVMLNVSPDFDVCYVFGSGTYDPSCADGYSNLVQLTVPTPPIRYTASVSVLRYAGTAALVLKASPLGVTLPYRVCYRNKAKRTACVTGSLRGYSWDSLATDSVSVGVRNLPLTTTFTWYVGAKAVASKRVRVPRS